MNGKGGNAKTRKKKAPRHDHKNQTVGRECTEEQRKGGGVPPHSLNGVPIVKRKVP